MSKQTELPVEGIPTGKLVVGDIWKSGNTLTFIVDLTAHGRVLYALSYQAHLGNHSPLIADLSDENFQKNLKVLQCRNGENVLPKSHYDVGDGFFDDGSGDYMQIMSNVETGKYFAIPLHGYVRNMEEFDSVELLLLHYFGNSWKVTEHIQRACCLLRNALDNVLVRDRQKASAVDTWKEVYPEAFSEETTEEDW